MRQTVEFIATSAQTHFLPIPDAFKLAPRGRLAFVQRWAWRFLHWAGALEQGVEPTTTFTRHRIEADKFIERLLKQRAAMFEMNREPRRLLIGSEDYAELMHSPEITPHHFDFTAEIGYGRRIVGLDVEVIPWMRGMVVMP